MDETKTKAFTYIYLSGVRLPIDGRRELMEHRPANLGIEIVEEFIEYGPLLGSARECPQFQRMLAAMCERGDIGAVLMPSVRQTHTVFFIREISEIFHEAIYGNRCKRAKGKCPADAA